MLSEDEKKEIEAEVKHCNHRQAACIEALKIVQRHRGWVSDEITEIAALLEMTAEELDSVATFYNLVFRKPVGRHVILVCDTVSCWVMGYEHIREYLSDRLDIGLGETTADGRFTMLPVPCLGACDRAPVMMIDDELHTDLNPEKIDEILKGYL